MSATNCPSDLLSWLAWTLSVDTWDTNWSEDQKRQSIAHSYLVHMRKGTVSSVREVLKGAGYGNISVDEGIADGTDSGWAKYKISLTRPISLAQAEQVKQILAQTVPARCHLEGLDYTQALHLYNHTLTHNGEYSHGAA